MEVLHPRCAGLDVHKDTVMAAVRCVSAPRHQEVRRFATTTTGLLALADWLTTHGCTHVAMEATSHSPGYLTGASAIRRSEHSHDVRTHFGYGPNTADVEPVNQDQASLGQIAQVLQHASLAQTRVRLGSATGLDSLPPEPSPSSPRKFDRAAPAFRRMNVAAGRALAR
jgi:hypothetical protein